MATLERTASGWRVGWFEPVTVAGATPPEGASWRAITDATGAVFAWRKYHHRARSFPTREGAEQFQRDVETAMARGERVERPVDLASSTIGALVDAYSAAPANQRTRRWRSSILGSFATWAGRDRPVSDLSVALLTRYADSLPREGRAAATRHRKVLAVEAAWAWGYDPRQRARFPGIGEPVRVTGDGHDVNAPVQAPAAVVRVAAPTVADVDAMIDALADGWRHGDDHRRVALLCRYTGLRIAQAVGLQWRDVVLNDLDAGPYLVIRSGTRGAKKGRSRVVPLHPALAAELAGWGVREGAVFKGTNERWTRGEATREAFRTAWKGAGVDPAKWDRADGERGHGSPTHAVRNAVYNHLLRAGVQSDVAQYAMGHATTSTRAAYVPEGTPSASPWWAALREAVASIPDHRGGATVRRIKAR